ncbi:H+/Cl-antiporter ClcA [Nakamurella panacisegetis]|uniref:H+/Cl-antiporter ClcA n=1 Tax=Nakamurella panacisegetis TaxID=1090615 RepID=A0A1H0RNW7_9ACTN|nr:chloride channel protein [Nakamurella panacisegetis]SDP30668.1 H+/Cl-antiporter ClcA [Nakamurella panacisegetis]
MADPTTAARLTPRLLVVATLAGALAGVGGVLLTLLLHLVQHLAFGYTEATFLTGVERASNLRRILALTIGGVVVGSGWWALRRWQPPVDPVEKILEAGGRPAIGRTTAEGVLQIAAVGFGASLGREGAPRLVGAALAGWLADLMRLPARQRRTILACGAGAGLACVYNVPLGGAVFTLEVLLVSAAAADVLPALLSAAVATAIGWPLLGDDPTYAVPGQSLHTPELLLAVILGPVAGLVGGGLRAYAAACRRWAPSGWGLPLVVTVGFGLLGVAAIAYPALLGNGKGLAQLAFDGQLAISAAVVLLILKPAVTGAMLATGANGGLLTPALATGAVLGALGGEGLTQLWPGSPIAACALIGAAAVLAAAQRAPLCAVVLVMELSGTGLALLVPIGLAVALAAAVGRAIA